MSTSTSATPARSTSTRSGRKRPYIDPRLGLLYVAAEHLMPLFGREGAFNRNGRLQPGIGRPILAKL
jgi:hypothetical protein